LSNLAAVHEVFKNDPLLPVHKYSRFLPEREICVIAAGGAITIREV